MTAKRGKSTVPVGRRGSSGVKACSISDYRPLHLKQQKRHVRMPPSEFNSPRTPPERRPRPSRAPAAVSRRSSREPRRWRPRRPAPRGGAKREAGLRGGQTPRMPPGAAPPSLSPRTATIRGLQSQARLPTPAFPRAALPSPRPARPHGGRRAELRPHLHNGGWSPGRAERGLRERGRSTARSSAEEPRRRAAGARRLK